MARAQGHQRTHVALKYFEALITIVVDIDIALLVNLRRFIEEHCIARLCRREGWCIDP